MQAAPIESAPIDAAVTAGQRALAVVNAMDKVTHIHRAAGQAQATLAPGQALFEDASINQTAAPFSIGLLLALCALVLAASQDWLGALVA